ncbi:uncharacterized protein PAC_07744 [Phialocephala subalpina]|uniref:Xylanolytic transcriptional activator regulatory domain-containing protein n=1 Tax=Phialocephala subalpina TaxID=576137 RepID=A0A1L7WYJ6_9HELO|nr:uncharacterized protein PAC_07744 [Phialocephala subalpina]
MSDFPSCAGQSSPAFQHSPNNQQDQSVLESTIRAPSQTKQTNEFDVSPNMQQAASFSDSTVYWENPSCNRFPSRGHVQHLATSAGTPDNLFFDLFHYSTLQQQYPQGLLSPAATHAASSDHLSTDLTTEDLDYLNSAESCNRQITTANNVNLSKSKPNTSRIRHNSTCSVQALSDTRSSQSPLQLSNDQCGLLSTHVPTHVADHLGEDRYHGLDFETALLLNGMFALSARFSGWDDTWTDGPTERGVHSSHLYDLTLGPTFQAWLGVGWCCRMAYSLSLHQVDRDPPEDGNGTELTWLEREEKRRAWWAIFQMDTFASVIASKPFNLDSLRMDVMLPGCENQDAYAWFLVANNLLRSANQEFDKQERSNHDLEILESALYCFALSLPPKFHICAANMVFEDRNYAEKNWALCTMVLLQSAHIFVSVSLELEKISVQSHRNQYELPGSSSACASFDSNHIYDTLGEICGQYINEHLRGLRLWPPDFMSLASPLVTGGLIGPAAVYATQRPYSHGSNDNDVLHSLQCQITKFALRRFAQYWTLGASMQGIRPPE